MTAPARRVERVATDEPVDRSIRPRRGLPGGRAVTGGLLVALAAVGTFAAVDSAHRPPTTRFLVASHDLTVGQRVRPQDLRSVVVSLPPALAARAFRPGSPPIGRVVLAPVIGGELIQRGGLGRADHGIATVAMALERADALDGALLPGDRVDVYVSYGSGPASSTRRILVAAEVVSSGSASESLGASGLVDVALAVPSADRRIVLVNGLHAGKVSLARVTGAPGPDGAADPDLFIDHDPSGESTATTTPAPTTTRPAR